MNNKQRALLLSTSILLTATACSNPADSNTADPPAAVQPNLETTPAEIVFYTTNGDPEANFNRKMGEFLRKKFPHYTIKYMTSGTGGMSLEQMLTTKTRFDIFMQAPGFFEAQAFPSQIQYDMTALIKKHDVRVDALEQTAIDYVKQASNGKSYFLPISLDAMTMFVNKTLFSKFGVPLPKDGMTWDQLMDTAARMTRTDGGKAYVGISFNSSTIQGMNPLSIPLANMDAHTPTINTDERWASFFDAFYKRPFSIPGFADAFAAAKGFPTITTFFSEQHIAMFPYQSSLINTWEEKFQAIDWDMVSVPLLPGSKSSSMATPYFLGITEMAKDKDAAMLVIKALLSEEYQKERAGTGTLPVLNNKDVIANLGQQSVFKEKNWGSIVHHPFAPLAPRPAYYSQLNSIYIKHFAQAAQGTVDLNTARRNAAEEGVQAIEKARANLK